MAIEWGRFTRHAKRAVLDSQELAASLGGSSVHPEHLIMTLLDDPTSSAVLLFNLAGVAPDELRCVVEERIAEAAADEAHVDKPAFSPAVRSLVEEASRVAGDGPVGTCHLAVAALEADHPLVGAVQEAGLGGADLRSSLRMLDAHELRLLSTAYVNAPSGDRARPRAPRVSETALPSGGQPASAKQPAENAASSAGPGIAADNSHTLSALARLVVDLAGKASRAARENGSEGVANQLDRMRKEAELQIRGPQSRDSHSRLSREPQSRETQSPESQSRETQARVPAPARADLPQVPKSRSA